MFTEIDDISHSTYGALLVHDQISCL